MFKVCIIIVMIPDFVGFSNNPPTTILVWREKERSTVRQRAMGTEEKGPEKTKKESEKSARGRLGGPRVRIY